MARAIYNQWSNDSVVDSPRFWSTPEAQYRVVLRPVAVATSRVIPVHALVIVHLCLFFFFLLLFFLFLLTFLSLWTTTII